MEIMNLKKSGEERSMCDSFDVEKGREKCNQLSYGLTI